jgi:hypothetical protein
MRREVRQIEGKIKKYIVQGGSCTYTRNILIAQTKHDQQLL